MSQFVYPTLEAAAARMPADIGTAVLSYKDALFIAMEHRAMASLIAKTPQAEGTLIESLAEQRSADKIQIGYVDGKANALDIGRKKSKPFSRQVRAHEGKRGVTAPYTRMLGSKQANARRGMTLSTGFSLRKQWVDIQTEAAARVGGEPE